jgi:hypothetical protein
VIEKRKKEIERKMMKFYEKDESARFLATEATVLHEFDKMPLYFFCSGHELRT